MEEHPTDRGGGDEKLGITPGAGAETSITRVEAPGNEGKCQYAKRAADGLGKEACQMRYLRHGTGNYSVQFTLERA